MSKPFQFISPNYINRYGTMKVELTRELIDRIIALHTEYRYYTEFTTTSEEDYIFNKITKEL